MDNKILDLIYEISDLFEENPQKVSTNLYRLIRVCSELILKEEYEELIDIKRTLDDELISESIDNYKSYNLGKAHTLIELVNALKKPFEMQELIGVLNSTEKKLLNIFEFDKDFTLSQLKEELGKENNLNISDYLSNLRNKDLISVNTIGKYRWYSLTSRGKDISKFIRNQIYVHEGNEDLDFNMESSFSENHDKKVKINKPLSNRINSKIIQNESIDEQFSTFNSTTRISISYNSKKNEIREATFFSLDPIHKGSSRICKYDEDFTKEIKEKECVIH